MPHITVKCFKGRTEEVKKKCADRIASDVAEIMGCDISSESVSGKEYEKDEWKPQVWDTEIAPEMDSLYKKPGYSC